MGAGLLDRAVEIDRARRDGGGGWGGGLQTGVGAAIGSPSTCAIADFPFPAAYVCVVSMCSKPPLSLSGGCGPV